MPFINDLCFPSCCCCSGTKSCLTPGNTINCSTPYLPVLHYLPEFAQTYVQWCHPTISSSVTHFSICLQAFPASGSFSNELAFPTRWPNYLSFSFSINPSNEYSGLISFRMDWLDLLAVQVTLKSLLQHQSSKASILGRLAFFMVKFSHPYVTTGKTIGLTRHTFDSKVMSLLFNMLSRLVITFQPRSKCLLILWL